MDELEAWVNEKPYDHVCLKGLRVGFVPTHNNAVESLIDGSQVYPRILEDLRAAQLSIRILQYGFKECKIGREVAQILMQKARAGVDVQVSVSALGSEIYCKSRGMYDEMASAGVRIVSNNAFFPIKLLGTMGGKRRLGLNHEEVRSYEHRKIIVVDSQVAYTGGMGFEDHFVDRMHDIMVRTQGDSARQLDALCEKSFQFYLRDEGANATALVKIDEKQAPLGRVTVLHNVPGVSWYKINEALFDAMDNTQKNLWVMNPYIGDLDITKKLCDAALRGVRVIAVFAGNPENIFAKGKQRAQYCRLLQAGVEIYQYPTLLHAKVLVRDDKEVLVGSMNLDNLATSCNFEIVLRLDDKKDIDFYLQELFAKDLLKSKRVLSPSRNPFALLFYATCGWIDTWFRN